MTRLELRVVVAAVMAATVVLGAVICAAYGQAVVRIDPGEQLARIADCLEVVEDELLEIETSCLFLRLIVCDDVGRFAFWDTVDEGLAIGEDPVHLYIDE